MCWFLKNKMKITEPIKQSGKIEEKMSLLEGELPEIDFGSHITYLNTTMRTVVYSDTENDASVAKTKIKGNIHLVLEDARVLKMVTYIKNSDFETDELIIKGAEAGLHQDIFGMDKLLDILSVGITGKMSKEGEIRDMELNSLAVLGEN